MFAKGVFKYIKTLLINLLSCPPPPPAPTPHWECFYKYIMGYCSKSQELRVNIKSIFNSALYWKVLLKGHLPKQGQKEISFNQRYKRQMAICRCTEKIGNIITNRNPHFHFIKCEILPDTHQTHNPIVNWNILPSACEVIVCN